MPVCFVVCCVVVRFVLIRLVCCFVSLRLCYVGFVLMRDGLFCLLYMLCLLCGVVAFVFVVCVLFGVGFVLLFLGCVGCPFVCVVCGVLLLVFGVCCLVHGFVVFGC